LHFVQRSQASTILLATAQPRLVHRIARQRSVIQLSREHTESTCADPALPCG
ncbi:unnamed protein product, partial [Staurois parvus]